jgi:type IV pilus assembly protein PilA
VAEGLGLAGGLKTGVTEYFASEGSWPSNNTAAGVPSAIGGNAVTSVKVGANGVITIIYNSKVAANSIVTLTPDAATTPGSIQWACAKGTDMESKWLPANCR